MSVVGVYDDNGHCVKWKNVPEHFGPIVSKFIVDIDEMNEWMGRPHGDVSVTNIKNLKHGCVKELFFQRELSVYSHWKSRWSLQRGTYLHEDILGQNPYSEKRFVYISPDGLKLTGQWDGYKDGYIQELKTTSFAPKEAREQDIMQAALYMFLNSYGKEVWNNSVPLELAWEHGQESFLTPRGIELIYAGTNNFKVVRIEKEDMPYFDPADVDFMMGKVKIYKEVGPPHTEKYPNDWSGTWKHKCMYCSYARFCKQGLQKMQEDIDYSNASKQRKSRLHHYQPPSMLSEKEEPKEWTDEFHEKLQNEFSIKGE